MTLCSKRIRFATVLILGMSVSTGCSVLPNSSARDIPAEMSSGDNESAPAKYYVEIHSNFGQPKLYTGSITEPTTVQNAMELSGAYQSVRSPHVDLYRMLPGGAPPLKLPIELKGKQVKFEQDYALHPNDRIVVRNKTNSPFDKIVDSLTPGK